ncbi:hypothetical protein [Streptomyces botrytidirepellens]|uniref:hypothetical protein n=1 Tax=Streptomyces botrytidirepellens TaxID=2486417 RepID=UPI0011CD67D0|nr:hypothetical protein [Streptomyces botrytidirepellens]
MEGVTAFHAGLVREDERSLRSKTEHASGDGDRFALPFNVDQTLGRFRGREELGDLCFLQDPVSRGLSEALTARFDVFTQVCAGLFLITLWLSRQPDPGAYDGYE